MITTAFISDLHISESKRLQDTEDILLYVSDYVCHNRIDYLCILGDVFDKRKPTPRELRVFNKFLRRIHTKIYAKNGIVILEGNHDVDADISSLSYLDDLSIPNIVVVKPPYKLNEFYLDHRPLRGAIADNGFSIDWGKDLSDIVNSNNDCKVFAFGDFHKPQILRENPLCFYAGSINKVNFSERYDNKFMWIFKDHKCSDRIKLPCRNMVQFDINVEDNSDNEAPWLGVDISGALVKLVYSGSKSALRDVNVSSTVKLLKDLGCEYIKVEYNITDSGSTRNKNIAESTSDDVALDEYLNTLNLDENTKHVVLSEGKKILLEGKNDN